MDGSCLASPRWVSLLVAELFYPHARFPAIRPGASFRSMSDQSNNHNRRAIRPPVEVRGDVPYIPVAAPSVVEQADDFVSEQHARIKRQSDKSGAGTSSKATYCDGVDDIGCYQVKHLTSSSIRNHSEPQHQANVGRQYPPPPSLLPHPHSTHYYENCVTRAAVSRDTNL